MWYMKNSSTMVKRGEKDKEGMGGGKEEYLCEGGQIRTEAVLHPHFESHTTCQVEWKHEWCASPLSWIKKHMENVANI